jgi:glyoxylate/succinic semialdehyde reductase
MQLADDMGMPAPISAAVNAQYIAARQRGLADADFAAIHASYDPPTQREN